MGPYISGDVSTFDNCTMPWLQEIDSKLTHLTSVITECETNCCSTENTPTSTPTTITTTTTTMSKCPEVGVSCINPDGSNVIETIENVSMFNCSKNIIKI